MKLNKKAQWGEAPTLLDWTAFIVLVIVIILAAIVFSVHSDRLKNKVNEVNANQEANYFVLNLLKTSIEIEGVESNIGELVSFWCINPDRYETQLKEEMGKTLEDFFGGKTYWKIEVEKDICGEKEIKDVKLLENYWTKLKRYIKDDFQIYVESVDTLARNVKTGTYNVETKMPLPLSLTKAFTKINIIIYLGIIKENSPCFNLFAEGCTDKNELCHCDREGIKFVWTRCEQCRNMCDPFQKKCV